MALNYLTFQTYPLDIAGIDSQYNAKITAIETFVKSDMGAVGVTVTDAILSYFVYWFLCQDKVTDLTVQGGETMPILKDSQPEIIKQVRAWNLGVDKLRSICGVTDEIVNERWIQPYTGLSLNEFFKSILDSASITINQNYLSKRSLL
jgi:hypothetical protein